LARILEIEIKNNPSLYSLIILDLSPPQLFSIISQKKLDIQGLLNQCLFDFDQFFDKFRECLFYQALFQSFLHNLKNFSVIIYILNKIF